MKIFFEKNKCPYKQADTNGNVHGIFCWCTWRKSVWVPGAAWLLNRKTAYCFIKKNCFVFRPVHPRFDRLCEGAAGRAPNFDWCQSGRCSERVPAARTVVAAINVQFIFICRERLIAFYLLACQQQLQFKLFSRCSRVSSGSVLKRSYR